MLVRFSSKSQSVSMHEADAKQMIQMMGMSGTIPSAVDEQSLPAALEALQQSIKEQASDDTNNEENNVDASVRAQPLVDMLTNAEKQSESVMWEYQGNQL